MTNNQISYNIAVVNFISEDSINGNVLILDNLQDPGNLGTIIRSATAFNIKYYYFKWWLCRFL